MDYIYHNTGSSLPEPKGELEGTFHCIGGREENEERKGEMEEYKKLDFHLSSFFFFWLILM